MSKEKYYLKWLPLFIMIGLILILFIMFLNKDNHANRNNETYVNDTEITVVGDIIEDDKELTSEQEYIMIPSLRTQYNISEENKEIFLINPEGNSVYLKYTLYLVGEEIYTTDYIKPDSMVKANLYDVLKGGTYNVEVAISSIDIETHAACNGAELSTVVTVAK
ncbi:MAG: hypothetical protein IKW08_08420 [Roseburia sp.]|nr:hypothetical protein [Roseburia sp.]